MADKETTPTLATTLATLPQSMSASIAGASEAKKVSKRQAYLECISCLNVTTPEEVFKRETYPGMCGHCGNAFRVI